MPDIRNTDDFIDSRDVIARIEELESEVEGVAINDETSTYELDGLDMTDEMNELRALRALADQCEGYGDWQHGETLIHEDYFTTYCEGLVSDIGDLPREVPSYIVIDWDATAANLKGDYMTVDFDGQDYLMRA